MKKILSVLMCVLMFAAVFPVSASATEEGADHISFIYYADGSWLEITVSESVSRASGTKTGSKTMQKKDSDGTVCWTAVLNGTFTYTGTSATCTASSCNVTISKSAFYVVSKTVGKSGGSATATLTMGKKFLGITISEDTYNLKLTCDKDGNLS